jgi:hypothetical protein
MATRHPRLNPGTIACVVALALGTAAAVGAITTAGGRAPNGAHSRSSNRIPGRVVTLSAVGSSYPLACVGIGVALHDPRFGRASFDRAFPCVRGLDDPIGAGGRVLARPPDLAIRRHT